MPPPGFSAATALDALRAGTPLQEIADSQPTERIVGAVRDALTGLRLGILATDEPGLRRIAGLDSWSIAMLIGHALLWDAAAHRIARSLARGELPEAGAQPYGEPGPERATREDLLDGVASAEGRLAETRVLASGGGTFAHTELGPLDARGWLLFIAIHDAAHLHQAAAIVRAR
ncbi:MAG TPA: DinB family protein [Candidatus Saccharimonadales bacterium]|nr:DinB family protein [Candidatus Saccharimonadales bacterium]